MKTKCSDCCHPERFFDNACGCCEGLVVSTPLSTANRPGLSRLRYRIGTHGSFLETMLARLSSTDFPALAGLATRNADDPSIAFCDAWAVIADVLTFYQERIANEGYLPTATERRSILELGRLVGYKLQPGIAASVFLAYTLDEKMSEEVTIPAGSRAQSVPGPGQLPQSFETREDVKARARWNNLKPRMTKPQTTSTILNGSSDSTVPGPRVYLKGITTNLKPNDPLLVSGLENNSPKFFRVGKVIIDGDADRTLVNLIDPEMKTIPGSGSAAATSTEPPDPPQLKIIKALTQLPSTQPRNTLQLKRSLKEQFKSRAETGYTAVKRFAPVLRDTLSTAAANARVSSVSNIKVYALRQTASLFGHNVPKRTRIEKDGSITIIGDWQIIELVDVVNGTAKRIEREKENILYLDAKYETIQTNGWLVVESPVTRLTTGERLIVQAQNVDSSAQRSEYGITAPTTTIELGTNWITLDEMEPSDPHGDDFNALRATTVYAAPEALELAEEPIESILCGGENDPLELDGFYEGLESGRWVIVSGERHIEGTSGVRFSELAMLASVTQDVDEDLKTSGDMVHTYITLAEELEYCFKRETITIHGNVVKATHGETREEVLGSGDGSKALQSFELKQFPLTHVSAANPTGVDSTLKLIVNDLQWHETDSLVDLASTGRNFITRTDNEDKTSVTFGNGRQGARLPTGVENLKARYRNGIGRPGNVNPGQISLLTSKPLGVKEVINPLRASGGADRESLDRARKNTPLAVKALDRLVSVQDYEDFARVYAGIGKASAVEIPDGRRQLVHVTIAGADDIPIDDNSDLFLNLRRALHDFGDPFQPIRLEVRELMMLVISAGVRLRPDYQWEAVVARLRSSLLDAFSFESRELGQDVLLSEVIAVMQAVDGVAFVDVDAFGGIPEKIDDNGARRLLIPEEISETVSCLSTRWSHDDMEAKCKGVTSDKECNEYFLCKEKYGIVGDKSGIKHRLRVNLAGWENGVMRPAQLAFLAPDLPDTLILNRIE
ncbi:MAG: putative baseplate assembly protein [Desulfobacteraceae bacterium]|nr:putative baseplate assembly protein [Desulfobacteraceae bacterium]